MNKLIILSIILAVCLVSAHAFAKRDTAAAIDSKGLENIAKDVKELGESITKKVQESLDTESLQKLLNDSLAQISKAVNDISNKIKETPAAPKQ